MKDKQQIDLNGEVSTFWLINETFFVGYNGHLVGDPDVVCEVNRKGNPVVKVKHNHVHMWWELRNRVRSGQIPSYSTIVSHSYDFYPRGYVYYNAKLGKFYVNADKSIVKSKKARRIICEACSLPSNTRFYTIASFKHNPACVHTSLSRMQPGKHIF